MEINRNNINEIVNNSNAKPDKDYGQNFLVEPLIAKKIVDALELNENEKVLEIGPGLGSLTHFLAESNNNQITCVDIDERMIAFLKIIYGKNPNISFLLDDIRNVKNYDFDKVIGNLPYNITTELIIHMLSNFKQTKKFVFMIQLEAFNRFFDLSGKEYGPSSIYIHLLGNIKKILTVKAGSFYPVPKCNSVVFEINIKNSNDFLNIYETYKLSKKLFLNRRKTIHNNLSQIVGKEKSLQILNFLKIPQNFRPEQISPNQYYEINQLKNNFFTK